MKILIVEDEKNLNSVINRYLKKEGYSVDSAFDGEEAIDFLDVCEYDAIIADIMMPRMNGYELVKKMRKRNIDTPILILTAKDSLEDRVKGLDIGADDFVVKPFEFEELIARIRALIRRQYGNTSDTICVDDLVINISEKSVVRNGISIDLTGKEYELFEFLMQNKGKVISRNQILEHIWDYDYEGSSNIIDVLIKNIRKKIDINNSSKIIHTKRGLGYVIKEEN